MPAIQLRDIHKTFRIPHEVHTTLTERLLHLFQPLTYERFEALRGVDLEIEKGAFVGIIGGNGSGKSTLLKIMSGLLPPDHGTVRVDGSMSALLELGLGFSAELTVRENVELYAAVLGYPRREAQRRVDEAIEFAGLDRFRDAKLKNLSTGMRARLGFATALQAESDILMLDEILAVGDADFQLKCLNVFEDLKRRRKTMVLVSHDLGQVQRFCDEAVWLNKGVVGARGDPDRVIAEYLKTVGAETEEVMTRPGRQRIQSDDHIKIVDVWLENDAGRRIGRVRSGDHPTIVVLAEAGADVDQPVLGIQVDAEDGTWIYSSCTKDTEVRGVLVPAGQTIEWRLRYNAALRNGRYTVMVGIANRDQTIFHDLVRGALDFVVHGSLCPPQGAPDLFNRVSYTDLQGRYTTRLGVERTPGIPSAADDAPPEQQKGGVR